VTPKHSYSIHDLLTVQSRVALPELEPFRVAALPGPADIQVAIGRVVRPTGAARNAQHVVYDEGWGPLGFKCRIDLGHPVAVQASPLLAVSPHVLYTNVVEPILRWTFAARGYTLVHGACLAWGQSAYLITALTDTGKTTTVLQLLANSRPSDPAAFISDDLTLLSPEGRVYTFPKPMTVSAHTLHAIDAGKLSWPLRLTLPWQSMIHSRGGRRTAHRMADLPLPVATINAITQMLVPPPKYDVQVLVPTVKRLASARLAGIFFIEWGADADLTLPDGAALDQLMRNGEDAYGFPPYHAIAPSLYQTADGDLRQREREIVASALQGVPKRLVRREHGNWWRPILAGLTASGETASGEERLLEWSGPQTSTPAA